MDKLIKVGIVEDNQGMRESWELFIDAAPDMVVLETAHSCEAMLESKELQKCDLLIMDIGLPGMSGIEGVTEIKKIHPDMYFIMASVHDDDSYVFEALKAGAIGYLMKKVTPDELVEAIRDAINGGSPITPNIARKVIETFHTVRPKSKENELTERELQILKELATGRSYAAIGKEIFLSIDGVRHHIRGIYRKLQVHSRSEAVSKGISHKLIKPS
ncbi:MAG: response regulator transcription factor [Balneola sp.]